MLRFIYKDLTMMHDSIVSANRHMLWPDPDCKDGAWMKVSEGPLSPLHPRDIVTTYKWVEGNFFD